MDIKRGKMLGLDFIEMQMEGAPDRIFAHGTRGGDRDIIISIGDKPAISTLETLSGKGSRKISEYGHYLQPLLAFRPFDEAAVFPGARVTYYSDAFDDFDIDTWARTVVDVPDSIDVTFTYDHYKGRLHVTARTMRKGAVARIRKRVGNEVPFAEAVEPILSYFVRNCPKAPEGEESRPTCAAYLNELLKRLNGIGAETVRRWMARPLLEPRDENRPQWRSNEARRRTLRITKSMMTEGSRIDSFELIRTERTNAIMCNVTLEGGHTIADDDQGITISIVATLPDTILSTLKGRHVSDVADADWARRMTIRTARHDGRTLVMRAFCEREPFVIPDIQEDPADVERRLRKLVEGKDVMLWIDEDAKPILKTLTPGALLSALSTLQENQRVDLSEHGAPGWILRRGHWGIEVEARPLGELREVIYEVLNRKGRPT